MTLYHSVVTVTQAAMEAERTTMGQCSASLPARIMRVQAFGWF